jgi:hypothetical protein
MISFRLWLAIAMMREFTGYNIGRYSKEYGSFRHRRPHWYYCCRCLKLLLMLNDDSHDDCR